MTSVDTCLFCHLVTGEDHLRKADGFEGLWDDVPALATPTTLVRGANSAFTRCSRMIPAARGSSIGSSSINSWASNNVASSGRRAARRA